jgi:predicted transcriptional regulator
MSTLVEIAGQLVAAHAASNKLTMEELLFEIGKVHTALKSLVAGEPVAGIEEVNSSLSVKDAFKKHEVICMICGKGGFKTLTRHLSTAHQLKPGAYKRQFGIPSDQSLSAKAYSEARKQMALDHGLADNLAKARKVRKANIEAKKEALVKTAKVKAPVTAAKATAKAKAPTKVRAKK